MSNVSTGLDSIYATPQITTDHTDEDYAYQDLQSTASSEDDAYQNSQPVANSAADSTFADCESAANDSDNKGRPTIKWSNLKRPIRRYLSGVKSCGSFAIFGCSDEAVQPGISTLSFFDKKIALQSQISNKNPGVLEFDLGEQACVNPAWHHWLFEIAKDATLALGLPGNISHLKPQKMLIHEPTNVYTSSDRTREMPETVAKLLVCLPGYHIGGAMHLKHNQEEELIRTDTHLSTTSWIAWYPSVTYTIDPIISGCFCVLLYSIQSITPCNAIPSSFHQLHDSESVPLLQTLALWRQIPQPFGLFYPLNHHYTQKGFQLARLRGHDLRRAHHLLKACSKTSEFCMLLTIMGGVTIIVDAQGLVVERGPGPDRIDEDHIIRDDCIDEASNSRRNEDRWSLSDIGPQKAMLLLIRKTDLAPFLLQHCHSGTQFSCLLRYLEIGHLHTAADDFFSNLLLQICDACKHEDAEKRDQLLGPLIIKSIQLNCERLFDQALSAFKFTDSGSTFHEIGRIIDYEQFVRYRERISAACPNSRCLYDLWQSLESFREGLTKNDQFRDCNALCDQWFLDRVSVALQFFSETKDLNDAEVLIGIFRTYGNPIFEQRALSFIVKRLDDELFISYLAGGVITTCPQLAPSLLPIIRGTLASKLKLCLFLSHAAGFPTDLRLHCSPTESVRIIVDLYKRMLSNLQEANSLLSQVCNELVQCPRRLFKVLAIPLIQQMYTVMHPKEINIGHFNYTILSTYIEKFAGTEPVEPDNWSRPADVESCFVDDCTLCPIVNEFLLDPERRSASFESECRHDVLGFYHNLTLFENLGEERIVIKLVKDLNAWKKQHEQWEERIANVRQRLMVLPNRMLEESLGERYSRIVSPLMGWTQNLHGSTKRSRIDSIFEKRTKPWSGPLPQR